MTLFALNHRVAPRLGLDGFLDLAVRLGVAAVEIRNDLAGLPLQDGASPKAVGRAAEARGLTIVSINALQRFNDWTAARADEARSLADQAFQSGARALVLCPVNEADRRHYPLAEALNGLAPILEEAGIVGLIEPLGFAGCSLRLKSEAVAAIDACSASSRFRLVHDTFHHFVAGEPAFFPARTGLVHISGVADAMVTRSAMRDADRGLIGLGDRIDTLGQMLALAAGGYHGAFSFEPFAPDLAAHPAIEPDLRASMDYLSAGLAGKFA